tara:strand:+ start:686 stop:913 length:228 start_codon:yes stop_codon:yes gene_type:complete
MLRKNIFDVYDLDTKNPLKYCSKSDYTFLCNKYLFLKKEDSDKMLTELIKAKGSGVSLRFGVVDNKEHYLFFPRN